MSVSNIKIILHKPSDIKKTINRYTDALNPIVMNNIHPDLTDLFIEEISHDEVSNGDENT